MGDVDEYAQTILLQNRRKIIESLISGRATINLPNMGGKFHGGNRCFAKLKAREIYDKMRRRCETELFELANKTFDEFIEGMCVQKEP